MGSWNETDGFGGMPIRVNDKVKAVIIQNNTGLPLASGSCNLVGMAKPISFAIDAIYNDYGALKDIVDNISSQMLFSFLSKELKIGSIKILPKSSSLLEEYNINTDSSAILSVDKLETFIDLIERDRVFRASEDFFTKEITFTNIGLMMFSDDIYQTLLSDNPLTNAKKDLSFFVENVLSSSVKEKMDNDTKVILSHLKAKDVKNKQTIDMINRIETNGSLNSSTWDTPSKSFEKYYNAIRTFMAYDFVDIDVFKQHYYFLLNSNSSKK